MPHSHLAQHIRANVRAALDEDIGSGDLTAQLIAEHTKAHATVITCEAAVLRVGCNKPALSAVEGRSALHRMT